MAKPPEIAIGARAVGPETAFFQKMREESLVETEGGKNLKVYIL